MSPLTGLGLRLFRKTINISPLRGFRTAFNCLLPTAYCHLPLTISR